MKWASAVSDEHSLDQAVDLCAAAIKAELGTDAPDLAIVFVSPHHAEQYDSLPDMIGQRLGAKHLIGCSAGGVIGAGREIEHRSGFSLTGAVLPDVELTSFHVENDDLPDLDAGPQAWENMVHTSARKYPQFLLITDPFTIQSQNLLMGLDYAFSDSTTIGGMASGGPQQGSNVLILDSKAYRSGAVGLAFHGDIVIDPIVAQGCRPIGNSMRITQSDRNLLIKLDERPALEVLRDLYESLDERDQGLAGHSLFLGMVMDEFNEDPQLGDFLIRNIVGMEPRIGALAVGEMLQEGQIVQFHLRDAQTSADDLAALLGRYNQQMNVANVSGALLFSCLGRGTYLYGRPDHDTELFRSSIGDVPLGGFFCNGEIGPVGSTTYLHGYTSSFGIFRSKGK